MARPLRRYHKDVDAILNYGFDWEAESDEGGPWLDSGVSISTSSWTVPAGLTAVSDDNDTTTTVVKISGGTVGEAYVITNHIVTSDGLEDDRSLEIEVVER